MIRLAGGLLVAAAMSLLGFGAARSLEAEYLQLEKIRQILVMIQSEMQYGRSFLAEAFLTVSDTQEEPYAGWLRTMYEKMCSKKTGSLSLIWEEAARSSLKELVLHEREKKRLYDLGRYLGQADLKGQIRHMDMYIRHLEEEMADRRRSMQTRKKLYRVLGVTAGILLAILLI